MTSLTGAAGEVGAGSDGALSPVSGLGRQPTIPGGGRLPDQPPGSPDLAASASSADEDRVARVGQVVHDLFAVSLALEAVLPYTSSPGRTRIMDAIASLDAAIRAVRQLTPATESAR